MRQRDLPENSSGHVTLLVPFPDRASHPVAEDLWQRIADKAKADLRLADVENEQRLVVSEAKLISVSVCPDIARTLLKATNIQRQLLHQSFDVDMEARKSLKELGCTEIRDQDLLKTITDNAESLVNDTGWIWTCWEWLAAWIAMERWDKRIERVKQVKELPIVPVAGHLQRASDLTGHIVTWRADSQEENLPDWLPLTFVDDCFRDRIKNLTKQDSAVLELCKELNIKEPGADVVQRAIGQAIVQFWKDREGDPARFLAFILKQDWYETSKALLPLNRCPVPLSRAMKNEEWTEARKAYFGREWGNDLLADLYGDIETVAWVKMGSEKDSDGMRRQVLEWLGIADCPRIVEESGITRFHNLPEGCNNWKKYLNTARDVFGRRVKGISNISKIDHLAIAGLVHGRAVSLVRLIAKYWNQYYSNESEIIAEGTQGRERYNRRWKVKAKWWWEVSERLALSVRGGSAEHVPLIKCWLPVKRTERAIGDLLPIIDLDLFANEKDIVHDWLIKDVGLRTQIEQVTVEEWKKHLSNHIPDKAPTERLESEKNLRDKVTGWYAACLETAEEQEDILENAFESCPLLCRKGDSWKYVVETQRYLDDDNEFAKAFAEDVWLFHIHSKLTVVAKKYYGVLSLTVSVKVQVESGEPKLPLDNDLLARFDNSLPYIWAWRSSQSKKDADKLLSSLKQLNVYLVLTLMAHLDLNGVRHEVERHWSVTDNGILLHKDHAKEAELAQALAWAVKVISEADFYENLLRCNNDDQRREKILSKGVPEAEVDRCLREYSGRSDVEEDSLEEKTKAVAKEQAPEPSTVPPTETQQQKPALDEEQDKPPVHTAEHAHTREQPFRLKDAKTVDYIMGRASVSDHESRGSGGGGAVSIHEEHPLTDMEKADLEEKSRCVARRKLKKMGYAVEEMPQNNPGFDLLGTRNGDELRVEVKAHTGRATVVDLTQRQYEEYKNQQGYRWELWNIEHLAEKDKQPVTITRYECIPEEALIVRTWRVNLNQCQQCDAE